MVNPSSFAKSKELIVSSWIDILFGGSSGLLELVISRFIQNAMKIHFGQVKRVDSQELILKTPPSTAPKWRSYRAILVHSVKGSIRTMVISYFLRGGISFVIRLASLFSKRKSTFASAITESFLGNDVLRFSTMLGCFSFLHKVISNGLLFSTGVYNKRNSAIAGAIASLAVLIETPANRVTIAQQFTMRAIQGGKNALKQRNLFHFSHADTLAFAASAASIMYAYTNYPQSIPRAYYEWVVQHGRVPRAMVELNRLNSHAAQKGIMKTYSAADLLQAIEKFNPTNENKKRLVLYLTEHSQRLPSVPCSMLHPPSNSCLFYCFSVWIKTFLDMIPVYASLNFIPQLILKTQNLLDFPIESIKKMAESTAISCSFLSSYVFLFQSGLCLHRNLLPHSLEPKYLFYLLGFITGFSILVEQKHKRAELAMYVLPKGMQSLYELSISAGRLPRIPGLDLFTTVTSFAVIMGLVQKEPHQLSPLLYKLIKNIIGVF